jgi:hypothetical protein
MKNIDLHNFDIVNFFPTGEIFFDFFSPYLLEFIPLQYKDAYGFETLKSKKVIFSDIFKYVNTAACKMRVDRANASIHPLSRHQYVITIMVLRI